MSDYDDEIYDDDADYYDDDADYYDEEAEDIYVPTHTDRIKQYLVNFWYKHLYWKLNKIFKWQTEIDDIPF